MIYGYHRTSTTQQHLDRGISEIENYCKQCGVPLERVYCDQTTGKNFDRSRYTVLKNDILRPGDELYLSEIDRLGRNKRMILKELRDLQERGIIIRVLEIPTTLMDFSRLDNELAKLMIETINRVLIELYASLAEAEMHKKEKRQREGIEQMKARGEWDLYGRPKVKLPANWNAIKLAWLNGEITAVEAMHQAHLSKSSFYRLVKGLKKEGAA